MRRVLFIFGTRPEAIKLAPVIRHLRAHAPDLEPRICVTAQHRDLLDQVLRVFDIVPDFDLDLMTPGQSLSQTTSRIIAGLDPVLAGDRPDLVLVQGDTTTTFCGALAAFYRGVPVGHVEAGLRTGDLLQPFPEELNRVLTTRLAALHFAPTSAAAENLRRESIPEERISITGNTGIDAVLYTAEQLSSGRLASPEWSFLDPDRRLILTTAHRRESFGEGFEDLCRGLLLVASREDVQIVFPVHPNPNVRKPVERLLKGHPRIHLIDPLSYVPFVDLMRRSYLLLTDSGGVQEEGPSLGKPVLVLREKTERPEGVVAGSLRLLGTNPDRIVGGVAELLDDPKVYEAMSGVHNVFGDGRASERITGLIRSFFDNNS